MTRATLPLRLSEFLIRPAQGSRDRGLADAEHRGDVVKAAILGTHPLRLCDLLRRHLRRPSADPALRLGVGEAAHRVLPDRVDAELREHGDHPEQRTAHRGRGVDHRLRQALNVHASSVEVVQRLDDDPLRASQPVEAPHQKGVALAQVVQARAPLGAVCDAAGLAVVDEYSRSAGRAQLGLLGCGPACKRDPVSGVIGV